MSGKDDSPNPGPGPYMTQVACLKVHMRLEKRLTRIELLSGGQLIAAVGLILTIAYYLWRLGVGG